MRPSKRDPAFYVLPALFIISAVIVLAVYGLYSSYRKHTLDVRDPEFGDSGYKGKPVYIERKKFGQLLLKVIDEDFGTGVAYFSPTLAAESVIGVPEAYEEQKGGRTVYSYFYDDKPHTDSFKDFTGNGFRELMSGANLTFVYRGNKLLGRYFQASPFTNAYGKWTFVKFRGKPLTEMKREDLTSLLGEPTESTDVVAVWYYRPTPPKPDNPIQALYVHAIFLNTKLTLTELYISLD